MMNVNCLYTTRKTQKSKRWQDGRLQINPESNNFVLYDDADNSLTSGVLRKSLQDLFSNDEDEYQFENKEYLIHIEKENVQVISSSTNHIVPVEKKSFVTPRTKSARPSSDLTASSLSTTVDLIQPRCIPSNPFQHSISDLLQMLDTQPSTSIKRSLPTQTPPLRSLPTQTPPLQSLPTQTPPLRPLPTQTPPLQSLPTQTPPLRSLPTQSPPLQSLPTQSPPLPTVTQLPSDPFSLTLPTYAQIRSKSSSFYASSTSSISTIPQYTHWISETCQCVIRSPFALSHSIFQEAVKQGCSLADADQLPPTPWLQTAANSFKKIIWTDCSLSVKETEFSKKRKRYEPLDVPRFFLTVPALGTRSKEEESGSLFNNLFVLVHPSGVFCFRCLWHGPTNTNTLEIALYGTATVSAQEHLTVLNCGSIDMEVRTLQLLPSFPSSMLARGLLQPTVVKRSKPILSWSNEKLHSFFQEFTASNVLNEKQTQVFEEVNARLISTALNPFLLIEGVFGSGKSRLISILLSYLFSLQTQTDTTINLLFCSHTNTAVDRVCLLLKEGGFTSFRRLGNIRKIHPDLRPFYGNRKDLELESDKGVMATTLCSLSDSLGEMDILVIDESSQVTEYYALLPILLTNPKLILLIGDEKQLPPVPIRKHWRCGSLVEGIPQSQSSMFERMLNLYPPIVLNTQYRCHPLIGSLASALFYQNQLVNGENTVSIPLQLPSFPRLLFVHNDSKELLHGESILNNGECALIQSIVNRALQGTTGTIGVISLYAAQSWALNRRIQHPSVQISTVDAFQGNEKDVIILSTVRSSGIGFTADPRRLNVAITRAKSQLIVIGNRPLLSSNPLWNAIVLYIEKNGKIVTTSELQSFYLCL